MEQYVNAVIPLGIGTEVPFSEIRVPVELDVRINNQYSALSLDALSKISDRILLIIGGNDRLIGRFIPLNLISVDVIRNSLTLVSKDVIIKYVTVEDKINLRDQELCSVLAFGNIDIFYATDTIINKSNRYYPALRLLNGFPQLAPSPELRILFDDQLSSQLYKQENERINEIVSIIRDVPAPNISRGTFKYNDYYIIDDQGDVVSSNDPNLPPNDLAAFFEVLQDNHQDLYRDLHHEVITELLYYEPLQSDAEIQSLADIVSIVDEEQVSYLRPMITTFVINAIIGDGANLINYENFPIPEWLRKGDRKSLSDAVNDGLEILVSAETHRLLKKRSVSDPRSRAISFVDQWFISNAGYLHWQGMNTALPATDVLTKVFGNWISQLDYTKTYLTGWPIIAGYYEPSEISIRAPTTHISLISAADRDRSLGVNSDFRSEEMTKYIDEVLEEAMVNLNESIKYEEDRDLHGNITTYFSSSKPNFVLTPDGTLQIYDEKLGDGLTFNIRIINPVMVMIVTDDINEFNNIALEYVNIILNEDPELNVQQLSGDSYIMRRIPAPGAVTEKTWIDLETRAIIIQRVPNITALENIVLSNKIPLERCCYGIVEDEGTVGLYESACCLKSTESILFGRTAGLVGLYLDSPNDTLTMSLISYPTLGNFLGINNVPTAPYKRVWEELG